MTVVPCLLQSTAVMHHWWAWNSWRGSAKFTVLLVVAANYSLPRKVHTLLLTCATTTLDLFFSGSIIISHAKISFRQQLVSLHIQDGEGRGGACVAGLLNDTNFSSKTEIYEPVVVLLVILRNHWRIRGRLTKH